MKKTVLLFLTLFSMISFITGCSIGDSTDSNITMSLRVSALTYIKENNETYETNVSIDDRIQGYYISEGRYDFYDENITGIRKIVKGIYAKKDDNCSSYGIVIDENTTAPIMKAPDKNSSGSAFAYININPFTTLLVDANYSKETLQERYPTAASVDKDFNFDTVSARSDRDFNATSLTQEICDALSEVISLQP